MKVQDTNVEFKDKCGTPTLSGPGSALNPVSCNPVSCTAVTVRLGFWIANTARHATRSLPTQHAAGLTLLLLLTCSLLHSSVLRADDWQQSCSRLLALKEMPKIGRVGGGCVVMGPALRRMCPPSGMERVAKIFAGKLRFPDQGTPLRSFMGTAFF